MSDIKGPEMGTVIGSDASFKGELAFDGNMRIEGKFEGKLSSKGKLSVGKGAQVAGELAVGKIAIEGTLKGNVTGSERIELASTAKVLGDIRAPRLVVAEGATFVGNCQVSPDALKSEPMQTMQTQTAQPAPAKK